MTDLRRGRRVGKTTRNSAQKIKQNNINTEPQSEPEGDEGFVDSNVVPLPLWSMKVSKRKSEQHRQALKMTETIATHLRDRYGIADKVYSLDLAMLKNAIELWLSCKREVDDNGVNLTKSVKVGDDIEQIIYANPAIRSMSAAEKSIIQFFARFGLSPSFAFNDDDLKNVPSEKKRGNNWLDSLDDED